MPVGKSGGQQGPDQGRTSGELDAPPRRVPSHGGSGPVRDQPTVLSLIALNNLLHMHGKGQHLLVSVTAIDC